MLTGWNGTLANNGFHELTDATEQRQRFTRDNRKPVSPGLNEQSVAENLLAALAAGIPDCSGVAPGVDRLIMLAPGAQSLTEVMAFTADRT